jgi:immune inhibitor A
VNEARTLLALHEEVTRFRASDPTVCAVAPHPDLKERIKGAVEEMRAGADDLLVPRIRVRVEPNRPGFNDGLIVPPEEFPVGTPLPVLASAAADRAPLRGTVRIIVVLVEFSDRAIGATPDRFRDLFFSTGKIATGSVREYYTEVSNGLVTIDGEVVGPYTLPLTLAQYCNGASGIGTALPNATTMARDAVLASDPDVDFAPYDNDGNGFVDAFVIVHAGSGAEQTGSNGDIWSHKWNVQGGAMTVDLTKIFGYLTIPEDALVGVSAHEVGHLLWGWPDLYDTDGTSEGIGRWCLMASGSWNGGGDTPAHPCGFLKLDQGWATVTNPTTNGAVSLQDVKDSHDVLRLWKDGTPGSEYFLVENRQQTRFDADLPGAGVLIWHIDEAITHNRDEAHYRVALMQADGKRDLENDANRGDGGDCYPGTSNNTSFTGTSTPNSKSYAGVDTCVSLTGISPSGAVMTANAGVVCVIKTKERPKELKDLKDRLKDRIKDVKETQKELKERPKELKDLKEGRKELKEKELKEGGKDLKERAKEIKEGGKEIKEGKEIFERPGGGLFGGAWSEAGGEEPDALDLLGALEARVSALEAQSAQGSQPFIGEELRPDLTGGAFAEEGDAQAHEVTRGGRDEKRELDQWQPGV